MRHILHWLGLPISIASYWSVEYWIVLALIGYFCLKTFFFYCKSVGNGCAFLFLVRSNIKAIHFWQVAVGAFAFSLFYAVILPVQTYLSNRELFDFAEIDLAVEVIGLFLLSFIIIFMLTLLSVAAFGSSCLLVSILPPLWGYIQLTVLSIGVPQLNGELWLLLRATIRDQVEGWFFVMFLIIFALMRKKLVKHFTFITMSFLIMILAYFFDGIGINKKSRLPTEFDEGFSPSVDVVKSVALSTNKNVIVIILDSASGDLSDEIVDEDPLLKTHFKGFVRYSNNIGMHDCTMRAVPALATGKYLEKDMGMFENEASFWGNDSALMPYKKSNYVLYIENGASNVFYTNRRTSFSPIMTMPKNRFCMLQTTKTTPYVSLFDVVLYRIVRYGRKYDVIHKAIMRGDNVSMSGWQSVFREEQVYPILKQAKAIDSPTARCFCWLHTEGAHIPVLVDKNGKRLEGPREDMDAIKGCQHYILRQVADLLGSWDRKGFYDKSLIILTTDHGIVAKPKSAMLWIKPFGSRTEMIQSKIPTSHSKISELLKLSVNTNLDASAITKVLRQDVRRIRPIQVSPDKWWQFGLRKDTYEIIYDGEGKLLSKKNLGEFIIN